jgi:hypothetical protein
LQAATGTLLLSLQADSPLTLSRSLYKYAQYFAKRHPKVTEDEKAVEVVVRLEESAAAAQGGIGRRLTVRTVRGNSTKHKRNSTLSTVQSEYPEDVVSGEAKAAPEPSGMSTPARVHEGIGAIDFTVPRYDDAQQDHIGWRYARDSRLGVANSEQLGNQTSATKWV